MKYKVLNHAKVVMATDGSNQLAIDVGRDIIPLLPTVTPADNGKRLEVIDGKWAAVGIYGVSWDLSANNKLTRTDTAANFNDPVPSVNGSMGSSPFDNIWPWAGMQIVEDEIAGSFVAIPKFYYRIQHTGVALNIQIADAPVSGFHVSPAHMDRGDGQGERDVVYIARYKCAGTQGGSTSNEAPVVNITRAQFRAAAANNGFSITDYAMFWTVRLLMLVEFATWDFQGAIGYGCGNGESAENTGSTDNMPYHTGTVSENIETYAVGVQYRHIEDLWANAMEFIDGWRVEESTEEGMAYDVYVTLNPKEFSDTEGGVKIGTLDTTVASGGFIQDWLVSKVKGYDWAMIPFAAGEEGIVDGNEFASDCCEFVGPALLSGGLFVEPYPGFGPFFLASDVAGGASPVAGARLQKI